MVKKVDKIERVPKCRICASPDREGIEMVGIMSCSSWNICRERINNTFGTNFTVETIKKHMMEHELHKTAMEQGVIIDSLRGKDGSTGRIRRCCRRSWCRGCSTSPRARYAARRRRSLSPW